MLQFEEKTLAKPTFKKFAEWEINDSIVGTVKKFTIHKKFGHRFIVDLREVHLTNNEGDFKVKPGAKFEIGCGVITNQFTDGDFAVGDICQFKYKGKKYKGDEADDDFYHLVTVQPFIDAAAAIPAPMEEEVVVQEEENLGDDDL